jgi:hypothetical protein
MAETAWKVALRTAICPSTSPGSPSVRPNGCSSATTLGTPTATVRSGTLDRQTVERPAASILEATSPTDQQQIGQVGTRRTRST